MRTFEDCMVLILRGESLEVLGGKGWWMEGGEQMLSVKGLSFTDVVCCSSAQVIWLVRGGDPVLLM